MRLKRVLIFSYVLVVLFGSVIEARWSKTLPRSENKKIPKITTPTNVKSRAFPNLPRKFQNKSDREKKEKYCRFLLGAFKECMTKYVDLKLGKFQENKENPYRQKKTSTTSSPPIDRHEKIYVRI